MLLAVDVVGDLTIMNGTSSSSTVETARFVSDDFNAVVCRIPLSADPASAPVVHVDGNRLTPEAGESDSAGNLTAILTQRLAGLDAPTRADLVRFIATAASDHVQAPGGLELAKRLRLVRDGLRERFPYSTVREDEPLALTIEEIHALDEQTFWIKGWFLDVDGPVTALTFISPEGASTDALATAFRHRRPDVGKRHPWSAGPSQEAGFLCCIRSQVPSRLARGWVAQARTAQGAGVETDGPDVKRDPQAAREAILEQLAAVAERRKALVVNHVHPAMECIHQQARDAATVARVEQYGSPPSDPAVSVVVPVGHATDAVEQQLAQFGRDPASGMADIVYVTDSTEAASTFIPAAAELEWLYGVPFRLIVLDAPVEHSVQMEQGAALARAPHLVFLGAESMPDHAGWLDALLGFKADHPSAGAVGPLLLDEDGSVESAGVSLGRASPQELGIYEGSEIELPEPRHEFRGMHWPLAALAEPRGVAGISGACLLLERDVFERVGGFAAAFQGIDYQALDLCLRIRAAGYANWCHPGARVRHFAGRSSPEQPPAAKQYDALLAARRWPTPAEQLRASQSE